MNTSDINEILAIAKEEMERASANHKPIPFGELQKRHLKGLIKESGTKIRNDYSNAALVGGTLGAAVASASSKNPSVVGLIASGISTGGTMSYIKGLSDLEAIKLEESLSGLEVGAIVGVGSFAIGALVNQLLK